MRRCRHRPEASGLFPSEKIRSAVFPERLMSGRKGLNLLAALDIHIPASSGSDDPDHQLDDKNDQNERDDYLHVFHKRRLGQGGNKIRKTEKRQSQRF